LHAEPIAYKARVALRHARLLLFYGKGRIKTASNQSAGVLMASFKIPRSWRLVKTLLEESDRGAVLAGAAYLDEDLRRLLRRAFQSLSDADDELAQLLGDEKNLNAPLQTFSARTQVARAMGLISSIEARALGKVRKLRNKFAHDETVDKITPAMADSVRSVIKELPTQMREIELPGELGIKEPRLQLILAIGQLHTVLRVALKVHKRFNPKFRRPRPAQPKHKQQPAHPRSMTPKSDEST